VLPLVLLLATVLGPSGYPQPEQTDTARMGLRGPVRYLEVSRALYKDLDGKWIRQAAELQSRVEFNEAGYKTEERTYGSHGLIRRNTYTYDTQGRLMAREEYGSGGLVLSWEKLSSPKGYSTTQIRYDNDGSVSNKVLQSFDSAGDMLSNIHYDDKGNTVQRWERSRIGTGSRISYHPRWGDYEITRFDSQGRMVEMRKGSGSSLQKWTYEYDTLDRVTEARYSDNNVLSPDIYTFHYNSTGALLEVFHSRSSGLPVVKRRYTYARSGSPSTETVQCYDPEGTLDFTWIYGYDAAGNVLDKEYRHALRLFSCRWTYRFDSSDRVIEEIFYDSEGRVFTTAETAYDGRGNKVSECSSGRGVAEGFRVIYEYDEAGRLLETIRYDLEGRQQSRQSSRYNTDLVETASYNPDGSLMSSTGYRYVYDEVDNWTERTTLSTNNAKETYDVITEVMSRTLGYFP
jgi:hypothetical protein